MRQPLRHCTASSPTQRRRPRLPGALALWIPALLLALGCSAGGSGSDGPIDADGDGFAVEDDCNDAAPLLHTPRRFYVDEDGDGSGSAATEMLCATYPPAGFSGVTGDCDDTDSQISREIPYYPDADEDGFGALPAQPSCVRVPPAGFVRNGDDPDDTNPAAVPGDRDGDAVADADDCNPDDARYATIYVHYEDFDADGLGGAPANLCFESPGPRYVSNDLDACPDTANSRIDFDADGIDDVCDTEIHLTTSRVFTQDLHLPHRNAESEVVTYRFGALGAPVEMAFEGAALRLESCVTLSLEGGSRLRLETVAWEEPAELVLGAAEGAGIDCETTIRGEGLTWPERDNRIEFVGARLVAGRRAALRHLEGVSFSPTGLLWTPANQQKQYGSDLHQLDDPDHPSPWQFEDLLTIAESVGDHALTVSHQFLDVGGVRFDENSAYPLRCVGADYRRFTGTTVRRSSGSPLYRTTCQNAIAFASYWGNGFPGPALDTRDESDNAAGYGLLDVFGRNSLVHYLATDRVYVERITYGSAFYAVTGQTRFNYLTLLPYQRVERDEFGAVIAKPIAPDVRIEVHGDDVRQATLELVGTELRNVPILLVGSGSLSADGAKLGPLLLDPQDVLVPGTATLFESTLDFAGSAYRVRSGAPEAAVTAGALLLSGANGVGRLDLQSSYLASDDSIDHPILFASEGDAAAAIAVDADTHFTGATSQTLIEQDASRSELEAVFELK